MGATYDVFISYSRADEAEVLRLAENLHQLGLTVFHDQWEIGPGDVFVHHLDRGILESKNGILVVSPAALASRWVREEYAAMLTRAVDGRQRLIPVLLKDVEELPPFLGSRTWIDLRGADGPVYERRVRELADALQGKKKGPPPRTGELKPRAGTGVRPVGTLRRTLRIAPDAVTYIDKDTDDGSGGVSHGPQGPSHGTAMKIWQLERARHRGIPTEALRAAGAAAPAGAESALHSLLLEVGSALTQEFLEGAAGEALVQDVAEAGRLGAPLELGLEVDGRLADLPWETLRLPGTAGVAGEPLVLHPNVRLYRAVTGLGPAPVHPVPGPLRVLVAIGSPEEQNEQRSLLDMERELSVILDAVEKARKQPGKRAAYVRVLERGTVPAMRQALQAQPFHVLHVTCHAGPGALVLEDEEGGRHEVDAETFCNQVLVPGHGVPVVVLAGCATALTAKAKPVPDVPEGNKETQGEAQLPGLARQLLSRGVPAVLAMQAPVSDSYATLLGERFYGNLATLASPDPLEAFAAARRSLEDDRREGRLQEPVDLAEWATPALYLRGPSLPLYDPQGLIEEIEPPPEPRLAEGVVVRRVASSSAGAGRSGWPWPACAARTAPACSSTAWAAWARAAWRPRCCAPWPMSAGSWPRSRARPRPTASWPRWGTVTLRPSSGRA